MVGVALKYVCCARGRSRAIAQLAVHSSLCATRVRSVVFVSLLPCVKVYFGLRFGCLRCLTKSQKKCRVLDGDATRNTGVRCTFYQVHLSYPQLTRLSYALRLFIKAPVTPLYLCAVTRARRHTRQTGARASPSTQGPPAPVKSQAALFGLTEICSC